MATPVIMPKFGMAQEEGTIIRWLKQEGERVEKGETLLEVQTDKIDMEVEAPASGILTDVRYGPDATVPVTTVIALIAAPEEVAASGQKPTSSAPAASVRASPVAQRMAAATGVDLTQVTGSGPAGRIVKSDVASALLSPAQALQAAQPKQEGLQRVRATPAARRLAREHGLDLAALAGSGPEGRIQAADVEQEAQREKKERGLLAADEGKPLPPGEAPISQPLRGKRRTIATRLSQSWQNAPHIFLTTSIDLTRIDELTMELAGEVEAAGGRLTLTVWIARGVAAALQRHPRLNAWLQPDGDQLVYTQHEGVHLGVAVAVEDGLLVPVVRHAETLGLAALAARISDLSARARSSQLTPNEVSGSTFTLSNLGMYPVEHFTAILNPPEVAILAVGRAQMQPIWNGAAFEPRRMLQVTLSADHRVIDGAAAATFLAELKRLLEEPARLLL